jgi:hypothetical protein
VLADGSKIGVDASAIVAPARAISTLVTSSGADAAELDRFRASGIEVVIADGTRGRARQQRGAKRTAVRQLRERPAGPESEQEASK